MGAKNITWPALGFSLLLMALPMAVFLVLKVRLVGSLLWSALRMSAQLLLVGAFLVYVFEWNNPLLTAAWLLAMMAFASLSVVGSTGLKYGRYAGLVFLAFLISVAPVLVYFNVLVLRLSSLLEARYAVAVAGMMLGNSLGGIIVGIGDFHRSIVRDEGRYQYLLAAGATRFEALAPYIREGITAALRPALANMATMGVVFLPGMMVGQMISGESPLLAVRYQIAIVVAIFVCVALTAALSNLFTSAVSFDPCGNLRRDIFRDGKPGKRGAGP